MVGRLAGWLSGSSLPQVQKVVYQENIDKYAEETQDFVLVQTCKIVTQYERELPKVAFDLMKLCNDSRRKSAKPSR